MPCYKQGRRSSPPSHPSMSNAEIARPAIANPVRETGPRQDRIVGIALMVWESLASGTGLLGNVFAFGIAITYAGQVTPLRLAGANTDMIPSALIAGALAMAVALPFAWPLATVAHDVGVFALMGVFQIGLPNVLMIRAARLLTATEVVLLGMVEVVLGPIWVWLAIGERPSDMALIGGAIVLTALAGNALAGSRRNAS